MGQLVVVGLGASDLTIDVQDLMLRGKTLRGCIEGDAVPATFVPDLVARYSAGEFPIDRLVTTYPAEKINEAIDDQHAGAVIKPVLLWG
ncbi:MAG: hypothetical protein H0U35_14175 [Sporichthyaceae bacterium]|nr:hypothetical protein [Sporichthyaceae bacterium]